MSCKIHWFTVRLQDPQPPNSFHWLPSRNGPLQVSCANLQGSCHINARLLELSDFTPLPTYQLKVIIDLLASFLVELFNLTLGVMPTAFKLVYITPLLKEGRSRSRRRQVLSTDF